MPIIATDNGGDFTPCPAGTHAAVCTHIIDIGTQRSSYQGKEIVNRQAFFMWELEAPVDPEDENSELERYSIGNFYTVSLSTKANLRKALEAWRGKAFTEEELKGFDLRNVAGKGCQIAVIHVTKDEKTKARVNAIMPLARGQKAPMPTNPPVVFAIDEWDDEVFNSIPEGIQKKIKESDEYKYRGQGSSGRAEEPPPFDDGEIPF
jgi:hypothetical protein